MALGTITLVNGADGPMRAGRYLKETFTYKNADATRTNDYITASRISKILWIDGVNQDNYGSSDPQTIDNSVFPPRVALAGVMTGDGGIITLFGL